jgi:hypothetical protein
MPTIISRGGMAGKAFGLTGQTAAPVYVEDVFSTYLYNGNGATQTITNGIDLAGKGGLVWAKSRSNSVYHGLADTAHLTSYFGTPGGLRSNQTTALGATDLAGVTSTGFSLAYVGGDMNFSGWTYASWTFREQPKFFDIVKYTGDGASSKVISHNLSANPGLVLIKKTSASGNWCAFFGTGGPIGSNDVLFLNLTNALENFSSAFYANSTSITIPNTAATNSSTSMALNDNGATYVVYMFAQSNSGGFGLTGSDSVVACGSFTKSASWPSSTPVVLGWEPQFLLFKRVDSGSENWNIADVMRGDGNWSGTGAGLVANSSATETSTLQFSATPTGFTIGNSTSIGGTYIYLAIRRGPMKVPTIGTSVYSVYSLASSGSINFDSQAYYYDLGIIQNRDGSYGATWADRLRGIGAANTSGTVTTNATSLVSSGTAAESTSSNLVQSSSGGFTSPSAGGNRVFWLLRRAAGFFDEVCYTGDGTAGSGRAISHNLSVAPEMIICKSRSGVTDWIVWHISIPSQSRTLNSSSATNTGLYVWGDNRLVLTSPSTQFAVYGGSGSPTNTTSATYVAYLFATCPGVSKVGSYTGTGAAQNIDCGFSSTARFILIKRTDNTGDWYVYDSAQGISSGNDPYLLWNSTAAQVTGTNYVNTFASGFALTATAPAGLNANGGSYIFLAIA